jgi:hypothetical protein
MNGLFLKRRCGDGSVRLIKNKKPRAGGKREVFA